MCSIFEEFDDEDFDEEEEGGECLWGMGVGMSII